MDRYDANEADAAEQHETLDRTPEPPTTPDDFPFEASDADAADQVAEVDLDDDDR